MRRSGRNRSECRISGNVSFCSADVNPHNPLNKIVEVAEMFGFVKEDYHVKKGYMISFNFNQKKEIGVKEIRLEDKILI